MSLIVAPVSTKDEEAALVIQKRRLSQDRNVAMNFALVQGFDVQTGQPTAIYYAHSSPGGSANLHAERNAFSKLCEAVGADFDQNDGAETALSLRARNICLFPKLYSELPPCPPCNAWLTGFARENRADVIIKYVEDCDGYFDLPNPYQRHKKFQEYIDSVLKD